MSNLYTEDDDLGALYAEESEERDLQRYILETEQAFEREDESTPQPVQQTLQELVPAQQMQLPPEQPTGGTVDMPYSAESMVGMPPEPQPVVEPTFFEQAKEKALAVGKDVAEGITEIPRAIVTGVTGAANEGIQTIYDLGNTLREMGIGPDGYFKVSENGITWEDGSVPEDLQPQLPAIMDDPDSTTGEFLKNAAQFMTGFLGAGKLRPLSNLAKGSRAAQIGGATAQGAIADFAFMDAEQKRLSNLFEGTALENDFTTWLAEGDGGKAENRFKNALEGAGLGVATDLFLQGAKAVRDYARTVEIPPVETPPTPLPPQNISRDLDEIFGGSAEEPLLNVKYVEEPTAVPPRSTAEGKLSQSAEDLENASGLDANAIGTKDSAAKEQVYINFNRIDSSDDIKDVIAALANRQAKNIQGEQRGTQTFEDIQLNAEQVNAWDTLMARQTGETLNAEEAVAARTLWVSSGQKLAEVAELAANNPSEANLYAFRRMATVHNAIQQQIIGARTETARSLASWRIAVGPEEEMARALNDVIATRGGADLNREMASRVAAMAQNKQYRQMDEFIQRANRATTWEMVQEAWINGLLSHPKTHIVNMASGLVVLGLRMAERRTAGHIQNALGSEGELILKESTAMLQGLMGGIRDAFRYAGESFQNNTSRYGANKFETENPSAITSESMGLAKESWLGKFVDVMGTTLRLPTRALTAEDEFFKTLAYRMELHSLAHRRAIQDVMQGKIKPEDIELRVQEIVDNPPTSVKLASADFAQYATFTNTPGKFGQAVQRLAGIGPMKILLPFVRTPANIFTYTMERTPFAPLMTKVKQEWSAGGTRRRVVEAQIAIGTATMLLGVDLTMNGTITGAGPSEPGERENFYRQGKKPYSIRIGDTYYAYNRFDPFGMQLSVAASIAEITQNMDDDSTLMQDTEKAAVAAILSIGNGALNKSYLTGLANFVKAISDSERYGSSWADRLTGSVVPSLFGGVARINDPYLRETQGALDAIRNRTPGLSENLPPRRDLWGRSISTASGSGWAVDFLSPVALSQYKPQPIDTEMERLDSYVAGVPEKVTFASKDVSTTINLSHFPGMRSRYAELAGNALRHPVYQKGCMDFLNETVQGKGIMGPMYQTLTDGEDGTKAVFIRNTINEYRKMARSQLMHESEQLRIRVNQEIHQLRTKKGAM